jgi:LysR family transcriptional regulator, hydrogen peroxide-inducible genes activator
MNFRDLEYLVAVADHGHFGEAAKHCGATQSTLSLQLQKLEAELGTQVIERTNRRIVITQTGQALVEKARRVLQAKQELMDEVSLNDGSMPAELTLGLIPTIAPYLTGSIYQAMQQAYPETRLHLVEDITANLERAVAQGEIDAAITATDCADTLIHETPLMEDELLMAVPADYAVKSAARRLPTNKLQVDRLIILKDGHCLRDQVMGFCTAQGLGKQHESLATSIPTLLELVRYGQGITLIPSLAANVLGEVEGVKLIKLDPKPHRQIRLITRKTSRRGHALAKLLQLQG